MLSNERMILIAMNGDLIYFLYELKNHELADTWGIKVLTFNVTSCSKCSFW